MQYCFMYTRAVEIVEVPVDVHDPTLPASPLVPSPVSPMSKVCLLLSHYHSVLLYTVLF